MGLKIKISSGYFLLILLLASIIYLYHGEELNKDALKAEESELADLYKLSQRVYTSLLDLSSQSEIAISWTEEESAGYRIKLEGLHVTLKMLKGYIHTPQQQTRIDSLILLLDEKSRLLADITTTFDQAAEVSEIVSEKIPTIVSRVRSSRTGQSAGTNGKVAEDKLEQKQQKKKTSGIFSRKRRPNLPISSKRNKL